jgi:hypothetical protein
MGLTSPLALTGEDRRLKAFVSILSFLWTEARLLAKVFNIALRFCVVYCARWHFLRSCLLHFIVSNGSRSYITMHFISDSLAG